MTLFSFLDLARKILFFCFFFYSLIAFSQVPANDLICNAVPVICGGTYSGSTIGATNSGSGESQFCISWNQNTPGVWYSFTGNGDNVTFSLCGTSHDSQIALYTGDCSAPNCYAANDDNGPACGGLSSSIAITTAVGQIYWIKVFSWTTLTPQFNFNLSVTCSTPPAAPANDLICNAIPVTCGGTISGTTTGATNFGVGELNTCGGYTQNTPGVWYSIVGNGDIITASLCGTSHDSQIAVFSGTCAAPVCFGSNDDNGPVCSGLSSSFAWTSVPGQTYFIKVFSWTTSTPTFNFNLNVTCATAPLNDLCQNAINISLPYNSGLQSNSGSTTDITTGGGSCGVSNKNVWFVVEGTGTTMTASTCNPLTNFDTEIHVRTGCTSGVEVACNDNASGTCSSVSWCSQIGVQYYISVGSGNNGTAEGDFELTVSASSISGAFLDNSYVWRGQTSDWFTSSNWVVVDSVDQVTTIFSPATVPPLQTSNVYITPVGGCTNTNPLIDCNGDASIDAFANNLTVLLDATLEIDGTETELYISGDYWNDGDVLQYNGYVVFNGSSLQTAGGFPQSLGYNILTNVRTEMTGPGIILQAPFAVAYNLDMISGNIQTSDSYPLVIGEYQEMGRINWQSGSIIGPMIRFIYTDVLNDPWGTGYDYSDPAYWIFPLGSTAGTIINRNAWINFTDGPYDNDGYGYGMLRGEFKLFDPATTSAGTNNLSNLVDPGNQLVYSELANEGYWEFDPNGIDYFNYDFWDPSFDAQNAIVPVYGGTYNMEVRANEFLSVPNHLEARLVKSPDPHIQWEWDGTHAGISGNNSDFTVSRTGLSDWSYFAIAYPQTPLNVMFGGANLICDNSNIILEWYTLSETNSSHFIIETSVDGLNFTTNQNVQAAGNSSNRIDYQILFNEKGVMNYVRISEIDLNGHSTVLATLSVDCEDDLNIFTAPNPSSNRFSIFIYGDQLIGNIGIEITDNQGKILCERSILREKGTSIIEFNNIDLESGIYYIRVSNGISSRIVKHSFR